MKKLLYIFFLILFSLQTLAQTDSSSRRSNVPAGKTNVRQVKPKAVLPPGMVARRDATHLNGVSPKPVNHTIRKISPKTGKPGRDSTGLNRGNQKPENSIVRKVSPKTVKSQETTSRRDSSGGGYQSVQKPETTVIRRLSPTGVKPLFVGRRDSAAMADSLRRKSALADSVYKKDSMAKVFVVDSLRRDSLKKAEARAVLEKFQRDTATYGAIMPIPYLPFHKPPLFMVIQEKVPQSKEEIFYLLCGLVLLVAFIRLIFPRYFNSLFILLFQTSFRQRQTKEQMIQDRLASLLMNFVFIISGGIYFELIMSQNGLNEFSFWWLLLYSISILGFIYLGKYIFLLFSGWVFNEKGAANTYIFVVFLVNKIIGIVLIPFLLILAFSPANIVQVAVIVSLCLLVILLFYRYLVSLGTIRRELKVSALHFFLYLCAIEVLPLLLIYKALFDYIGNSI